jgi:hypothetical protein
VGHDQQKTSWDDFVDDFDFLKHSDSRDTPPFAEEGGGYNDSPTLCSDPGQYSSCYMFSVSNIPAMIFTFKKLLALLNDRKLLTKTNQPRPQNLQR